MAGRGEDVDAHHTIRVMAEATKLCFAPTSRPSTFLARQQSRTWMPITRSASWPGGRRSFASRRRPGHPRSWRGTEDVDARDKPGHDGGGAWKYEDALRACAG